MLVFFPLIHPAYILISFGYNFHRVSFFSLKSWWILILSLIKTSLNHFINIYWITVSQTRDTGLNWTKLEIAFCVVCASVSVSWFYTMQTHFPFFTIYSYILLWANFTPCQMYLLSLSCLHQCHFLYLKFHFLTLIYILPRLHGSDLFWLDLESHLWLLQLFGALVLDIIYFYIM